MLAEGRRRKAVAGKSLQVKMTQRDSQTKATRGTGGLFEKYATRFGLTGAAILLVAQVSVAPLFAQTSAQTPRYQSPINAPTPQVKLPTPAPITPNGVVVEDVIVQVNDQIINRSDLERAQQQLQQDAQQSNASPAELADRQKTLLRDLIDQQLLLSRGKELGITADTEVIRRLDEVRKQNKLDSLEDLEKAVRAQGISYEDYKANLRNSIITQQVVRDEVGRRLQLTQAAEQAYYDAHKADFTQPEQVRLSEILVPLPENPTDLQISQAQAKADGIAKQIKAGDKFEALAKLISGGQTAAQGGDLGLFKRGALAKVLEDQTFDLQPGQNTAPIRTRQGFVILKVTEHQGAGTPPLKDIEPQVQEAIYAEQMQPALRAYLTKLREGAYIDIKSGFVDAGASSKQTKPVFSAYSAPVSKKQKQAAKKRFDRSGGAINASTTAAAAVAKPAVIKLDKNGRPKKVKREKIRFGQAPEQSLPPGPTRTASGADTGIGTNQATGAETPGASATLPPGQAMAPLESTSNSLNQQPDADPLAPKAPPAKKTRYSDRAPEVKVRKEKAKEAKVTEKKIATPTPMSSTEATSKQVQAAPLGLNGDTATKKKHKRKKGEAKERLQPKPKDPNAPQPDATGTYPTPYHAPAKTPATTPAAGDTTLPPATAPAPGAPQSSDTTPATPNTPIPTTPPNQ
jgi:peptidyl-prolyl cis-trans isomerase SurA